MVHWRRSRSGSVLVPVVTGNIPLVRTHSSNVDHSVLARGGNSPNKLIAGPETADSIDPWHRRQGNPKLPEVVRDYLPLPAGLDTMMPVG